MKNLKASLIVKILVASICAAILYSCSAPKSALKPGWYTYKQIKKSGYDCEPFKGRHYIRATVDSSIVNIVRAK
jgi:hypothetical protein